ncbi:MAG: phage holin family protein [Anaerolineae bacterium]|nr:phage holin family protein [Anaerolineae bacterium]
MAYFFTRVFVNTLAVAIVLNLVPGLRPVPVAFLPEPFATITTYIIIGLIFSLLHSLIRPAILLITGRLYIWSMGLSGLATDIFIFMILIYISPTAWQAGAERLFWAAAGAIMLAIIMLALEALFGFGAPRAINVRKRPFYWRWIGLLPAGRRNRLAESLRTQQIVNTIQAYLTDILIGFSPFSGFRHRMQKMIFRLRPRLIEDDPAVKMRLLLQDLGPTFVKVGQMASNRSEVPETWRIELARLQDDVAPFPYNDVSQTIERELGKPPEELFATFDRTPLAAASTGQVHAATLPGGEMVVVKVRRPDIEVTVKSDLNIIQDTLNMVEKRVAWTRRYGLSSLFHEFAENIVAELNYRNESYNARLLRHQMGKFPSVQVPVIYTAYSTVEVLTQERVSGVKITDLAVLDAAKVNREELAITLFRVLLQQVLFDGFFHADPHPGNVWVNLDSGRIIFLDMGLMGQLELEDRVALGELIWALQDHDAGSVTRILGTICYAADGSRPAVLRPDIERLINENLILAESPPSLMAIMTEIVAAVTRHGFQLRPEFTLAIKAIGQGEAIMQSLLGEKPMGYILNIAYTQMKELLRDQLTLENLVNNGGKPFLRDMAGRLPALQSASRTLLDDFQNGQLAFQVTVSQADARISKLSGMVEAGIRRIVLSLLLVGLMLGSILTLLIPFEGRVSESEGTAIRLIAISGLVIAMVYIAITLLSALWRSIRQPRDG